MVVLDGEEVDAEIALGRTSKAVRRMSMALFICEILVYVLVLEFSFERGVRRS